MKKSSLLTGLAALAALITLSSCGKKDDNTLYLFNWTYYTPDSVLQDFEKEYNCKVKVDTFDSNEVMYAKLKAGADGYDITFPSQDYTSIMIKQGMLKKIDHAAFTNASNINPKVLEKLTFDPNMDYSVPYYMGAAGICVNKQKVHNYNKSWTIFEREDLKGHMTMMDDMREVMGDALALKGYSVNTVDSKVLGDITNYINQKWKPNLVKFDAEGFGKSFASGDFWLCQGYPEIVYGEVDESLWEDTIEFFIPPEGGPATMDCMVVLKDAPNPELANEFINFIHRPEMYAIFIDTFRYPCIVNTEALQYTTKPSMYPPEQANTCTLKEDLGDSVEKFYNIWQRIRFAD